MVSFIKNIVIYESRDYEPQIGESQPDSDRISKQNRSESRQSLLPTLSCVSDKNEGRRDPKIYGVVVSPILPINLHLERCIFRSPRSGLRRFVNEHLKKYTDISVQGLNKNST